MQSRRANNASSVAGSKAPAQGTNSVQHLNLPGFSTTGNQRASMGALSPNNRGNASPSRYSGVKATGTGHHRKGQGSVGARMTSNRSAAVSKGLMSSAQQPNNASVLDSMRATNTAGNVRPFDLTSSRQQQAQTQMQSSKLLSAESTAGAPAGQTFVNLLYMEDFDP